MSEPKVAQGERDDRLWVVEYSVNNGRWHISIHDHQWFRVAITKAEAEEYAAASRKRVPKSWRYRVVRYIRG